MKIPLLDINNTESRPDLRIALFDLGFRPFFLLAGITAVLLVPLWIFAYTRGQTEFGYYTAILWHGHEMLFGYTVAVIAGFLLTAVRNWTELPTPGGNSAGRPDPAMADRPDCTLRCRFLAALGNCRTGHRFPAGACHRPLDPAAAQAADT